MIKEITQDDLPNMVGSYVVNVYGAWDQFIEFLYVLPNREILWLQQEGVERTELGVVVSGISSDKYYLVDDEVTIDLMNQAFDDAGLL